MRPSIAELRAVAQPPELIARRSAEHWAGRWYMRRVSLRVTRLLVATRISAHAVTAAMIVTGLVAAAAVVVPAWWSALIAVALIQFYLLLDCVDGEVARWRGTTGAAGVYLDRLGHHVVEAALVVALGVRAAGGPGSAIDAWVLAGAIGALLVVIGKLETDLIIVARAAAGLPTRDDADPQSGVRGVRAARRVAAAVPVHRLIGAVELTLLLVVAAIVDVVRGDLVGSRTLLGATVVVAAVVAIGHPLTILTSKRLR